MQRVICSLFCLSFAILIGCQPNKELEVCILEKEEINQKALLLTEEIEELNIKLETLTSDCKSQINEYIENVARLTDFLLKSSQAATQMQAEHKTLLKDKEKLSTQLQDAQSKINQLNVHNNALKKRIQSLLASEQSTSPSIE